MASSVSWSSFSYCSVSPVPPTRLVALLQAGGLGMGFLDGRGAGSELCSTVCLSSWVSFVSEVGVHVPCCCCCCLQVKTKMLRSKIHTFVSKSKKIPLTQTFLFKQVVYLSINFPPTIYTKLCWLLFSIICSYSKYSWFYH